MTDSHEVKTEMLEAQMRQNHYVDLLLGGAAAVSDGGVQGIKDAANTDPELLLVCITGMAKFIQLQKEIIADHLEARLRLLESLESINNTFNQ